MKLPRDLTGNQIVRALLRLDFVKENQVGSHLKLAKGSVRVTLPVPGVVHVANLRSILRQARLTIEELMEEI